MQGLFSRLSEDLESKAGASEIQKALEDMTFKIDQASNEQTRLQRLGRALGKDQNSSAVMKRLQIELEQVWSRGWGKSRAQVVPVGREVFVKQPEVLVRPFSCGLVWGAIPRKHYLPTCKHLL